MMSKFLNTPGIMGRIFLAVAGTLLTLFGSAASMASEKVSIAIISFSPYAPWYIVQEKNLAESMDLEVRIIEDITAKNAALTTGTVQCMLNTLDSVVVARAAEVPVKVIAIPAMSYGLDEMVVSEEITSIDDFPGKSYGADYAFLNHMWMLLTLKRAGMDFSELEHKILLPQDSAAAFVSGVLDIDVNYVPFSRQSLQRQGAHVLKTSLSDRTWERGLISESISCNEVWLEENPELATELLRAWFEAVDWWKANPEEGNRIIAEGLDWPVEDVRLTQYGAIMLTLDQNLGAFGVGDGKPVCASLPEGIREPPADSSGWGAELFNGAPDCVAGYAQETWELFGDVYKEAGVIDVTASAGAGVDTRILEALEATGYADTYSSNTWIGRTGP